MTYEEAKANYSEEEIETMCGNSITSIRVLTQIVEEETGEKINGRAFLLLSPYYSETHKMEWTSDPTAAKIVEAPATGFYRIGGSDTDLGRWALGTKYGEAFRKDAVRELLFQDGLEMDEEEEK